jgi:hypothetical protein
VKYLDCVLYDIIIYYVLTAPYSEPAMAKGCLKALRGNMLHRVEKKIDQEKWNVGLRVFIKLVYANKFSVCMNDCMILTQPIITKLTFINSSQNPCTKVYEDPKEDEAVLCLVVACVLD